MLFFSVFCAVLCAERVGQMTKTYNDIDAVTRLLEEVSMSRLCFAFIQMCVGWSNGFTAMRIKNRVGAIIVCVSAHITVLTTCDRSCLFYLYLSNIGRARVRLC